MAVASSLDRTHPRPRGHPAPVLTRPGSAFDIIELKPENTTSFYLRVRASGALFLVAPARCPEEPRLWSLWVHRCLAGGVVDATQPSWASPERLRREELAPAAQAIHNDVDGWIARKGRDTLRRWLHSGAGQRS